ncbi:ABC transporter ATP-binding protein [Lachnospira multipara]|uniref:ABC transporter ATP-binding protein n=1 Tax=Lachnospira multipara TaxID=28051 RepID=UPI0004E217B7|nr:ATP-binding cassette domain-containing protein [Lachnospira multipara]
MLISAKNITKRYGKNSILKDINLEVNKGECAVIIGSNGCGKTTLLSILAGSNKPTSGQISIDGNNALANAKVFDRMIGYIPQENPLMEGLSVKDNLKFWYMGTGRSMEADLVNGAPVIFGVDKFLNKKVEQLSGGMKKRLSICAALAKNPPILILDEPGASLDIVCKQEIKEYIKNYMAVGGTVILASHEDYEIGLATKMYLLNDGVLKEVKVGTHNEVMKGLSR